MSGSIGTGGTVVQGFPASAPVVNATGTFTDVWLRYFQSLWTRTGGAAGGDLTTLSGDVTAAQAAAVTAQAAAASAVPLIGGTMTGPLVLSGAPTVALDAATKGYVDAVAAGGMVQPATATPLADGTAAVGTSLLYARQDHVHPGPTIAAALAAAGTTLATATPITTSVAIITTCAAGAGVLLPAPVAGEIHYVRNRAVNALLIYPQSGASIEALAASAAASVAAGADATFIASTTTTWTM